MTCKDCDRYKGCGRNGGTTPYYTDELAVNNIAEVCAEFKEIPKRKRDIEVYKYMTFSDILNFFSFDYKFKYGKEFPFTKDPKEVKFSEGQIIIPKQGIFETVQNKVSDIKEYPLKDIKMLYQIPFAWKEQHGIINQDIKLTFRYDKQYKYGDINKSIYEVCFYIVQNATPTNNFYIIDDINVCDFFSYFVANNQWGIGCTVVTKTYSEAYDCVPKKLCDTLEAAADKVMAEMTKTKEIKNN